MHTAAGLDDPTGNTQLSSVATNLGFYGSSAQQPKALSCFVQNDIPYHWALAQKFGVCDHYFCSLLAGTAPNRNFATLEDGRRPDVAAGASRQCFCLLFRNLDLAAPGRGLAGSSPRSAGAADQQYGGDGRQQRYHGSRQHDARRRLDSAPLGSYLSDLRASPQWSDTAPLYAVYEDWNWMPEAAQNAFSLDARNVRQQ